MNTLKLRRKVRRFFLGTPGREISTAPLIGFLIFLVLLKYFAG